MNLDKNSSEETIDNKINDKNTSITNNESNASINNVYNLLKKNTNISTKKLDINITTDKCIKQLKRDINITDENSTEIIKENIDFTFNNIDSYREKGKPFITFNGNVVFLSKENLLVFGEGKNIDKEKLFKLNLKQFLKNTPYKKSNNITIYREGRLIECEKTKYNYVDSNGKNVKIYFGDIISSTKENIEKDILDINSLEYSIGSVKINKITKKGKLLLINLDTRFTGKIGINILYNKKDGSVLVKQGEQFIKELSIFDEDIEFYKKFRSTFNYFKDNNMFDEPLNEKVFKDGKRQQLDGNLREPAIEALRRGKKTYSYNGLDYNLYKNGKISIPQVCIDYPFDFYEKFNNSYFDNKGNHPDKINFEKVLGGFFARRRVGTFIKHLKENINNINKYFTINYVNKNLSIAYNDGSYVENIIKEELSKHISIGDLILIEGKLNDGNLHRHTVMVSRIQSNGNIIIQENAAYPKEETLLRVISRGPNRKIKYIVKPTSLLNKKI